MHTPCIQRTFTGQPLAKNLFTATGTRNGQFITGKRGTWSAMNIYTFRDGLPVREYASPDLLAVLAQIGALRGPQGA